MRALGIAAVALLAASCQTRGGYVDDSRAFQSAPAVDPFARDGTSEGVDGRLTVSGDVVLFEGDCGTLMLRRISGRPVLFDEPGVAHRALIERYDRKNAEERCNGEVGDDVALVASTVVLPAEFAQAPTTLASVRPLAGGHVLPWWFAAIPVTEPKP